MKSHKKMHGEGYFLPIVAALLVLGVLLSACQSATAPLSVPTGAVEQGSSTVTTEETIRLVMLPLVDALPVYVAEQQGYFASAHLKVTVLPAASAAERDQLIAAGQGDGMINDLISVGLYNKQSVQIQTVRFAMTATSQTPMFRVLAAKDSALKSPADLAGVPVGISQGTIIDYVTTRLLEQEGLTAQQIQSVAVPKLPDRLALLGKGELKAATLPEPFGSLALQSGAVAIVDDSKYPSYGSDVWSFRKEWIDQHPQAVRAFLQAVERATQDINARPDTWRALLITKKLLPEALKNSYVIPPYPTASVPTEAQWRDGLNWMQSRKMISADLPYADSVTGQYLPGVK